MEKYKTMTITESEAKKHGFPAKAIGYWAIVEESEEYKILHRLNKDGTLGSDRPDNILKVKVLTLEEFFKNQEKDVKQITVKKDGKEVVIAESRHIDNEPKVEKATEANIKMDETEETPILQNLGTRRSRWIAQLLEVMKSEPFTNQLIEKMGKQEILNIIVKDLHSEKKPYSSITSAMRVWNTRIRKGEFAK